AGPQRGDREHKDCRNHGLHRILLTERETDDSTQTRFATPTLNPRRSQAAGAAAVWLRPRHSAGVRLRVMCLADGGLDGLGPDFGTGAQILPRQGVVEGGRLLRLVEELQLSDPDEF